MVGVGHTILAGIRCTGGNSTVGTRSNGNRTITWGSSAWPAPTSGFYVVGSVILCCSSRRAGLADMWLFVGGSGRRPRDARGHPSPASALEAAATLLMAPFANARDRLLWRLPVALPDLRHRGLARSELVGRRAPARRLWRHRGGGLPLMALRGAAVPAAEGVAPPNARRPRRGRSARKSAGMVLDRPPSRSCSARACPTAFQNYRRPQSRPSRRLGALTCPCSRRSRGRSASWAA